MPFFSATEGRPRCEWENHPHLRTFVPPLTSNRTLIRCDGRGIGIIDFASALPQAFDSAALLISAGASASEWSDTDQAVLVTWAAEWLDWLLGSSNGKAEAAATNNHGSWYDQSVLVAAGVTGNTSVAARVCSEAKAKRVDAQLAKDGSLPAEDSRTASESYHAYGATALLKLAVLCDRPVGRHVDLFPALRKMMKWIEPYAKGLRKWPYKQIRKFDPSAYTELFSIGASVPEWAAEGFSAELDAIGAMQPEAESDVSRLVWYAKL